MAGAETRDGAAIGIELRIVRVDPPLAQHAQDLGRERFVELDEPDVVEREPGSLERFAGRRRRPQAHKSGLHANDVSWPRSRSAGIGP